MKPISSIVVIGLAPFVALWHASLAASQEPGEAVEIESVSRSPELAQKRAEELAEKAMMLQRNGESESAADLLLDALRLSREQLGDQHQTTVMLINNYAFSLIQLGRAEQAVPLLQEALRHSRRASDGEDLRLILSISNYAYLLTTLGRYSDAEPLFD